MYARRFQSLALDYMNHCDANVAEQDSQSFAMLLLENAKIPASVYSTVVTQLVTTATTRTEIIPESKICLISKDKLETILAKATEAISMYQNLTIDATATEKEPTGQQSAYRAEVTSIRQIVSNALKANERHEQEDRTTFRVTLSDAVEVLSDIKVQDNEQIKRYGSMLGKRDYIDINQLRQQEQGYKGYTKYGKDKRQKQYIPNGQGPKAQSRCKACKEPNHWYKDPECIYNVIRALMENKDIEADIVQKLPINIRKLFEDQNGGYKKRVPVSNLIDAIGENKANNTDSEDHPSNATKSYFR